MGVLRPLRSPAPLGDHALDQLDYIRSAMERATSFTAVPGLGGVCMGLTALAAAWLASRRISPDAWLQVWLSELVLAAIVGVVAMYLKSRRQHSNLLSAPARKFAACFIPAVAAGGLLTAPLHAAGLDGLVAAVWLLLYGVAITAAGTFSVRVVPAMGLAFLAFGAVALVLPAAWRDLPLACGFGGLHIGFGFWIWRHYGG
jgi:hypothetical protein